jgi:hypothetical protein
MKGMNVKKCKDLALNWKAWNELVAKAETTMGCKANGRRRK